MTQGVAEVVAAGASTPSHTAPQPRKIAGGTGVHVRRSHIQRAHICRQHTHTASKQARGPTNRPLYQLLDLLAMQPRRCLTRGPGQPQLQAQRRSDNQPLARVSTAHELANDHHPTTSKQASRQDSKKIRPLTVTNPLWGSGVAYIGGASPAALRHRAPLRLGRARPPSIVGISRHHENALKNAARPTGPHGDCSRLVRIPPETRGFVRAVRRNSENRHCV